MTESLIKRDIHLTSVGRSCEEHGASLSSKFLNTGKIRANYDMVK